MFNGADVAVPAKLGEVWDLELWKMVKEIICHWIRFCIYDATPLRCDPILTPQDLRDLVVKALRSAPVACLA